MSESDRPESKPAPKAELSYGASLLVAAVVAFVMLWAGPIITPSSDLLTYFTARMHARLTGGFYPTAAREQITVLLIDDETVARVGQGWPIPYGSHARWLRNLGELYQPRAIFMDITFGQERKDPTLPTLMRTLCGLRDKGIPVFLAALADDDGTLRLRSGMESPPGEAPCYTKVDVRYNASTVDRLVWSYPLWTGEARSAALAVAQDAAHIPIRPTDDTMALSWGVNNVGVSRYAQWCRQTPGGFIELLPSALRGFLRGEDNPNLPICPYSRVVTMSELLDAGPQDEARLQDLLHNRYVMIGAALSGYNDTVLSPVNEMIPGIFMHAMALDNLLTYGQNYKRALDWTLWPPNALWLLGLPVVMIAHFLLWALQTLRERYHWCERMFTPLGQWHQLPRRARLPAASLGVRSRRWRARAMALRRRTRTRLKRRTRVLLFKAAAAVDFTVRKVLEISISGGVVLGIVMLAQRFFNVGTQPVIDLATMALAAQWLGWTNKFTAFLFRKPRALAAEESDPSADLKPRRRQFRQRMSSLFKRKHVKTSPQTPSEIS